MDFVREFEPEATPAQAERLLHQVHSEWMAEQHAVYIAIMAATDLSGTLGEEDRKDIEAYCPSTFLYGIAKSSSSKEPKLMVVTRFFGTPHPPGGVVSDTRE